MVTEETVQSKRVSAGRLWFGTAAAAIAWAALGFVDILITWVACVHREQFGNSSPHPLARALYIAAAIILFGVVLAAGIVSYRSWRSLSKQREILQAAATERREFMALLGVFVSITAGAGVVWLSIPPLFFELCLRAK